jgi:hypothetical protein
MTEPTSMKLPRTPLLAGIVYFGLVFALGFVLGTVRTLFVQDAPSGGRLVGVLIELPIMIGASWFLCRFVIRRFAVAPTVGTRAVMGGLAFALLMLAELAVGALLFGRTPLEHFALYRDPSYALGLVAQIAFALMPMAQMRLDEPAPVSTSERNGEPTQHAAHDRRPRTGIGRHLTRTHPAVHGATGRLAL